MISTTLLADSSGASGSSTACAHRAATLSSTRARDAELVRRFNGGDEGAFTEIVERYRAKMSAVAYSLLHNQADAEEIAQETFIRAYRALARFRGEASLSTWLHRITFNLSRNRYLFYFRRHRQSTLSFDAHLGAESSATFGDVVADNSSGPAREAAQHEFLAQVTVGMKRLTVEHRDILTRRSLLDQSYEEIAEALGLEVGTVKSRIARARKHLRTFLEEIYGGIQSDRQPFGAWFESHRPAGHREAVAA